VTDRNRIVGLTLDERTVIRRSPDIEHERRVAIYDLLEDNRFRPHGLEGPFRVHLGMQESRLVLDIRDEGEQDLARVQLPLTPFRRVIKDYFTVCESYFNAIRSATPAQIEAIDMGRRGLHNEGSERLRDALADRIELDLETARRLFTLICVLQIRG
jgi:uncharacterized protein (UPF0262 family)